MIEALFAQAVLYIFGGTYPTNSPYLASKYAVKFKAVWLLRLRLGESGCGSKNPDKTTAKGKKQPSIYFKMRIFCLDLKKFFNTDTRMMIVSKI